jgi:hypothetical protein
MRAKTFCLCLGLLLAAGTSVAQTVPKAPGFTEIYCSGQVISQKVPLDSYLISGEQSNVKITFATGDYVYINRGATQGARVGDEYLIMREVKEPLKVHWNKWQKTLTAAMGTIYRDAGRVRIVNVLPKTSIAEVVFACDYLQRGDLVRPVEERPVPPFKETSTFDKFAPVSGKPVAMIVQMYDFTQASGNGTFVYVNLGSKQGVKVGDYFRAFRYQGTRADGAYQTAGFEYKMYGFGSAPVRYTWGDLPREVLGEGIVLRAGENASVVLVTYSRREIYTGDYVELE